MPEVQIQFDPFSFVVALVAVGISIWAIVVAKKAPHAERLRGHRDAIRDALFGVDAALFDAAFALDQGTPVADLPESVSQAHTVLVEIGPRLPEQSQIWVLEKQFFDLRSLWNSVTSNEARLVAARENVTFWETAVADVVGVNATARESANRNLGVAKTQEQAVQRALDASRLSLRDAVKPLRTRSKRFVKALNDMDRRLAE